ncbi:YbjN domain-containing protein [bacterium]|nr:YbjN domain-containing protein [bacterium]
MRRLTFVLSLLAVAALPAHAADVTLATVKEHLAAAKIEVQDAGDDAVQFKTGFPDGEPAAFFLRVDAGRKYVYVAIVDLARVEAGDAAFCDKARRLLALNYKLALVKLEWVDDTGEVRLSHDFATEGGLTQNELIAAIQRLLGAAEQVRPLLAEKASPSMPEKPAALR